MVVYMIIFAKVNALVAVEWKMVYMHIALMQTILW